MNESNKFNFVIDSAATIAEIICRYAVIEEVYIKSSSRSTTTSPVQEELERALVQFYAVILVYLSKTRKYFREASPSQHHRFPIWPLDCPLIIWEERWIKSGLLGQSELESYFSKIAAAQEAVDRCRSLVSMKCGCYSTRAVSSTRAGINDA